MSVNRNVNRVRTTDCSEVFLATASREDSALALWRLSDVLRNRDGLLVDKSTCLTWQAQSPANPVSNDLDPNAPLADSVCFHPTERLMLATGTEIDNMIHIWDF